MIKTARGHTPFSDSGTWKSSVSTVANRIGFITLCILLILVPFHFVVKNYFLYYREFSAAVFACLFFAKASKTLISAIFSPKELAFFSLFLIFLLIAAVFDPGINLYQADYVGGTSEQLAHVNPTLYVLRNAFLYAPVVYYFALRGLSKREINIIAGITALVAPLSVLGYIQHGETVASENILYVLELGGAQIGYNSYVPYLTFPFMASMYLFNFEKKKTNKLIFAAAGSFLFLFMLASTSRQSFLFCAIALFSFFFLHKAGLAKSIGLSIVVLALLFIVFQGYEMLESFVHPRLVEKYSHVGGFLDTQRFERLTYGLSLLNWHEFFWGAGLSSVVTSGPHNDFIRWTQRVGVPVMVIGFMPFFLAMKHSIHALRKGQGDILYLFISLALFYTIFHSLFGYPRDDAYQALFVYLGLAMWLGLKSQKSG